MCQKHQENQEKELFNGRKTRDGIKDGNFKDKVMD
jgi:hypothetical protein